MTGAEFTARLRELGLSQKRFAASAAIATSTVNRWATDRAPVPGWAEWIIRCLQNERATQRRNQP